MCIEMGEEYFCDMRNVILSELYEGIAIDIICMRLGDLLYNLKLTDVY